MNNLDAWAIVLGTEHALNGATRYMERQRQLHEAITTRPGRRKLGIPRALKGFWRTTIARPRPHAAPGEAMGQAEVAALVTSRG